MADARKGAHKEHLGLAVVVTTVQDPTPALQRLVDRVRQEASARVFVVGDRKSPEDFQLDGADYFSLRNQQGLGFKLAKRLPVDHYARKSIGYLAALAAGAACIYETDDDNEPLPSWQPRNLTVRGSVHQHRGWVNAYAAFTEATIWPRGYPLDALLDSGARPRESLGLADYQCVMQQGLVNGAPDVDAVWRLTQDRNITFRNRASLVLGEHCWCPTNSQSTWWWPPAFPLLYLPSSCPMRVCDIWRGFVAQRCISALGGHVAFHSAEAYQERNQHVLMDDFRQEWDLYVHDRQLVELLDGLTLDKGPESAAVNVETCYEALVQAGFLPVEELAGVHAWLEDVAGSTGGEVHIDAS